MFAKEDAKYYLPPEILLIIFSFMSVRKIIPILCVSKCWQQAANQNYLWQIYLFRHTDKNFFKIDILFKPKVAKNIYRFLHEKITLSNEISNGSIRKVSFFRRDMSKITVQYNCEKNATLCFKFLNIVQSGCGVDGREPLKCKFKRNGNIIELDGDTIRAMSFLCSTKSSNSNFVQKLFNFCKNNILEFQKWGNLLVTKIYINDGYLCLTLDKSVPDGLVMNIMGILREHEEKLKDDRLYIYPMSNHVTYYNDEKKLELDLLRKIPGNMPSDYFELLRKHKLIKADTSIVITLSGLITEKFSMNSMVKSYGFKLVEITYINNSNTIDIYVVNELKIYQSDNEKEFFVGKRKKYLCDELMEKFCCRFTLHMMKKCCIEKNIDKDIKRKKIRFFDSNVKAVSENIEIKAAFLNNCSIVRTEAERSQAKKLKKAIRVLSMPEHVVTVNDHYVIENGEFRYIEQQDGEAENESALHNAKRCCVIL